MTSLISALQDIGMLNATDMIGGYKAWQAAGLPSRIAHQSSVTAASEIPSEWNTDSTLSSLTVTELSKLKMY